MSGFTEYDFAIRFRNVIRKVVYEILSQDRPADKIGRVVDVDRSSGTARVVYSGDESNPTRVKMYPGIQPQRSDKVSGEGNGSVVRVSGPSGKRYIAQVLSDGAQQINSRLSNPTISAGGFSDSTIRSIFCLSFDSPPPADGSVFDLIELYFPNASGHVTVTAEFIGVEEGYLQRDTFKFDDTSTRYLAVDAVTEWTTSSGMDFSVSYYLSDGNANESGRPIGSLGCTIYCNRLSTSTKNPTRMNVYLDVVGGDVEVVEL